MAGRALLREGIASLLHNTPYKVTAAAAGASDLEQIRVPSGREILAIVGVDKVGGSSAEISESIRLLRSTIPNAKIVIVAETNGPVDMESVSVLAADGYIVNLGSRDILLKVLELTLLNQQVFVLGRQGGPPDDRAETRPNGRIRHSESGNGGGTAGIPLSHRERQVLICLARGESNKVIARLCQISEATVKVHLKAILRKTNACNRTQAAIWAIEHGLCGDALAQNGKIAHDAPSLSPADLRGHVELEIAKS